MRPHQRYLGLKRSHTDGKGIQTDSTGTIAWTLDGNSNATQTNYNFTPARNGVSSAVETASYNNQDLRSQYTDIAGLTTQWRYNNNDQVENITYPSLGIESGDTTSYTFDARNRTRSAIMKGGSVSYEYFNDDQLKKASYANGAVSNYTYTPRNQVESIKHSINSALVSELSYTYDSNDNRKTETKNNGTGEVVTRYDFDNNDRIERIDYPAQYNELAKTVAYQFDAANNRELETITQAGSSSTKTYTYNNLDQLTDISSTDAENTQVKYSYDDNGNLAQKRSSKTLNNITQTETNDYAFDIRGQLKSVTMGGSSIGQFLYDDGGQRLRTQYNTLENGQATTQTDAQHSLYQGLKLISQYDLSDSNSLSLNANFQFAGGMNIGRRAYGESDSENNTQTYYHTDALGSVLATSKANKSIAARYDYDAWGKELNNTDTSDNPIGYTGHQMDRESENKTGLIYANARYLDPDTGRFLSFDPFAGYDDKPISLNKYLYAYQNPVRYLDPDGNEPITITAVAIYTAWSGVNAGINTGIDYGFHKVFGSEGDNFNAGETLGTNFAISMATGGVGGYLKHAPKAKKIGESATEFAGEVYKEYNANKENGASIGQATLDTAISMTIGKAAAETIGKKAGELYSGTKSKLATLIESTKGQSSSVKAPNNARVSSGAESSAQYAQLKDNYRSLDPSYTPLSNKKIAGNNEPKNFPLANSSHPETGVWFTPDGYADFSPHSVKTVQIKQTGNNDIDFRNANIEAGYGTGVRSHVKAVPGHTWHHHQNGIDMELVKTDPIHKRTGHSGGADIEKKAGGANQ